MACTDVASKPRSAKSRVAESTSASRVGMPLSAFMRGSLPGLGEILRDCLERYFGGGPERNRPFRLVTTALQAYRRGGVPAVSWIRRPNASSASRHLLGVGAQEQSGVKTNGRARHISMTR